MARISLIVLATDPAALKAGSIADWRRSLEGFGLEVEVVVAAGPGEPPLGTLTEGASQVVLATERGRASAAFRGLERAKGDILLVLDPALGYDPADLARLAAPLVQGQADLVVASRWAISEAGRHPGKLRAAFGQLALPITGTTDPLSGLIGVTREAWLAAGEHFRPVGGQFSFELLSKVQGRRLDIPVRTGLPVVRSVRVGWDDIRHLKRLADHRYGNLSRLFQFCVVGGSGMVWDLSSYFLFRTFLLVPPLTQWVVWPTKITVADALTRMLAISVAVCWNFWLNRRLTFSYARGGSVIKQFIAYVLFSNGPGIVLSLGCSLALPRKVAFFNDHRLVAALIGIVVATALNFSMARWVVFRRKPAPVALVMESVG